jgi:hypothetical protein
MQADTAAKPRLAWNRSLFFDSSYQTSIASLLYRVTSSGDPLTYLVFGDIEGKPPFAGRSAESMCDITHFGSL